MFHVPLLYFEHLPLQRSLHGPADQVTWEMVKDHQSTEITQYHPPYKPSNNTDKLLKPLYERMRKLANGSLNIRDAVQTDESWYRCKVNEKTCYEVELVLKGVCLQSSVSNPININANSLTDID